MFRIQAFNNNLDDPITIAQQPEIIGQYGVDMAVAALDGGQVTPKVQTGFTIITKDNVDGDAASAVYKSSC